MKGKDTMRIKSIIALMAALLLFAIDTASATSPMPGEETLGLQTANVCTIRIVYSPGKDVLREAITSTLTFEASMPKKDRA